MTPDAEHYVFTLLDMAAKGYVNPATWKDPARSGDRMMAYRCFDSAFDHELGLVVDLGFFASYAGESRPTFVADALPSFTWLMLRYVESAPDERAGRIIFVENGEQVPLDDMARRFQVSMQGWTKP